MARYTKFFLFLLLTLFCYSSISGQGQLFSREVANQKFGPILQSVDIPISTFLIFTNQSNVNHLMFRISNNQAIILDGQRNVLYPAGSQVNSEDVFTVFSISVIKELLSNSNGSFVSIEQRAEVLSISFDQKTMEVGSFCPPICP